MAVFHTPQELYDMASNGSNITEITSVATNDVIWIGGVPEQIFVPSFGEQIVHGRSGSGLSVYVTPDCIDISDINDVGDDYRKPHFNASLTSGRTGIMQFSVRTEMADGETHPDLFAKRLLARTLIYFAESQPILGVNARWHEDSVNYEQYTDALEYFCGIGDLNMIRRLAAKETWTARTLAHLGFRCISGPVIETKTYEGRPMVNALFTKPGGIL